MMHRLNVERAMPTGAKSIGAGSAERILHGVPVNEIFPEKDIWDIVNSPNYCSGVVHIPGEIENALTIKKLSIFNQLLVNRKYDFHEGIMQPGYTQSLQRELDVTSAELLPAKLYSLFLRESNNWYSHSDHHLLPFFIPSPLEQLNYPFLSMIIISSTFLCLGLIFLFLHIKNKKRNNKKNELRFTKRPARYVVRTWLGFLFSFLSVK